METIARENLNLKDLIQERNKEINSSSQEICDNMRQEIIGYKKDISQLRSQVDTISTNHQDSQRKCRLNWDQYTETNQMLKEKESLLYEEKINSGKLTDEKVNLQNKVTSLEEIITKSNRGKVEKAIQTENEDCRDSEIKLTQANPKNAELMEVNVNLIEKDIGTEKIHQKKISRLKSQVDKVSTNLRESQVNCRKTSDELSKTMEVLKEKESLLYEETKNKGRLTEVIINLRKQVTSLEENITKQHSDKAEKEVQTFFAGIRNVKRKRHGAESVLPQSIENLTGKGIIND